MIRNKVVLILIFTFAVSLCAFSQRIKYKDYKDDISVKNYREIVKNPKYSPTVAGIGNFMLPSSGYFYVGEPLRGVCVFGCELATGSVFIYGLLKSMSVDNETGQPPGGAREIMYTGVIAAGLIHAWSIYDVVKITKIKNLAYQENKLTIDIKPDFLPVSQNNDYSLACGLKLRIKF